MKLINQYWTFESELPKDEDVVKFIEKIGRVCYKSEDKITNESGKQFIKFILKSGHESVIEHFNITIRAITNRGVTHEIVRHRIAAYSQESTRYCNYGTDKLGIKFIKPSDFDLTVEDIELLEAIEKHYNKCIQNGRTPQQARYFLPNGLKTEIVMTYNLREWRHFFKLRTKKGAHPDMIGLAISILNEFKEKLPSIFGDL